MNKMSKLIVAAGLLVSVAGVANAGPEHVNPHFHPNLAEAQNLLEKAQGKIHAAQVANEYDMDGHAAKARELIDQAQEELKQAAIAANKADKDRH